MNRVVRIILLVTVVLLVVAVPVIYDQNRTVRVIHSMNVLRCANKGGDRGNRGDRALGGSHMNRHMEKQMTNTNMTNAVHNHVANDHHRIQF